MREAIIKEIEAKRRKKFSDFFWLTNDKNARLDDFIFATYGKYGTKIKPCKTITEHG